MEKFRSTGANIQLWVSSAAELQYSSTVNGEAQPAKQTQSTLILLFLQLMQSPALSKQIPQVFMERSYFTTKKHC
jgi:hypothetical protein